MAHSRINESGAVVMVFVWLLSVLCLELTDGLECSCTTEQCNNANMMTCTALNTCYVQVLYMLPEPDGSSSSNTGEYVKDMSKQVIRGCIDESMPLLCENRRPDGYNGQWPILHCCRDDWCNNKILPTDPPWLLEDKDTYENSQYVYESESSSHEENEQNDNSDNKSQNLRHFNILYIAVPIAGACIVLALVIFSLYLLKMNRQNMKNCGGQKSRGGNSSITVVKSQKYNSNNNHQRNKLRGTQYSHPHITSIYKQKLPLMVEVKDHRLCCGSAQIPQIMKEATESPCDNCLDTCDRSCDRHKQQIIMRSCDVCNKNNIFGSCDGEEHEGPPPYCKMMLSSSCDTSSTNTNTTTTSCDRSCDHCDHSVGSEARLLV